MAEPKSPSRMIRDKPVDNLVDFDTSQLSSNDIQSLGESIFKMIMEQEEGNFNLPELEGGRVGSYKNNTLTTLPSGNPMAENRMSGKLFDQVKNVMMQDNINQYKKSKTLAPQSGKMRISDTPSVQSLIQNLPNRFNQPQSQPFLGFSGNAMGEMGRSPDPQSQPFLGFSGDVMGKMGRAPVPQQAPRQNFRSPEVSFDQMQNNIRNIDLYRGLGQPSPMPTNRAFIVPPDFGY